MKVIAFHQTAFEQYNEWAARDKKTFERVKRLISDTARNPFEGIGKPEPLKRQLKGYWSRRVTDEHRLVYKVTDTQSSLFRACTTTSEDFLHSA
jgi:toxin YoeB